MTLTQALVSLKLLDKRISAKISKLEPVAVKKGAKFEASIKSQDEFEREAKATWQSITDLMTRRRKIKAALVLKNSSTAVTIAGESMTIAEAIERKNMIETEECMVRQLRRKLIDSQRVVDKHNEDMKAKLLKLLEATYAKRESQVSREDYDRIARPFNESNEAKLVDPLNADATARAFEDKFEVFAAEVDVSLSIANATSTITI